MEITGVVKYVIAISAAVVIVTVLLQARSGGLGTVFGGGGGGEAYRSKRGVEGVLFKLTITFAIIFAISSLLLAWVSV